VNDAGPVARAAELATLGHHPPLTPVVRDQLLVALESDPDSRVRAAAVGALVRAAPDDATTAWLLAGADADALDDTDVTVVEAAAWSLGELGDDAREAGAVRALSEVTRTHRDALAREAAVAALGALGDADALPTILDACRDKPAVRRRAVLALAPFDGPEVDAAIAAALADRDWQVRQAAEDLQQPPASPAH
jgi:HEAT repeat protein